jgi:hypothetical protein
LFQGANHGVKDRVFKGKSNWVFRVSCKNAKEKRKKEKKNDRRIHIVSKRYGSFYTISLDLILLLDFLWILVDLEKWV